MRKIQVETRAVDDTRAVDESDSYTQINIVPHENDIQSPSVSINTHHITKRRKAPGIDN